MRTVAHVVVRWPWLVIAFWIGLAATLSLAGPSLTQMAQQNPVALLPADAPSAVTAREMTEAFDDSGSENVLLIVLTNESGLGPADEATYRTLVDALRADTDDVVMVQDFLATPQLREVLTSKDNQAWYIPVSLAGELGSPRAFEAYTASSAIVKDAVDGSTLTAYVTGPAATVVDLGVVSERDVHLIEIATAAMVLAILLIIYRRPVTMLLPLITIGVSLVTAQGIVAVVSSVGGLGVSTQSLVLMTGMMVGAGTDYAVFLISRYHDFVREGAESTEAVAKALTSIGKVIAASAATVAITFLGMSFATLGVFSAGGPALAISIIVAFAAAITFLPAVLTLTGPRGWIAPRRDRTTRFWRRSGVRIVRRPVSHLVGSLVVLVLLAACVGFARFNYDDRKTLPQGVESTEGYAAMDRHFPLNSTIPQYLFVSSPRDLRSPEALADLEEMARRVSQLPGIAMVRGITRPTGESLQQARLSFQAGEIGDRLAGASDQITDHTGDLDALAGGADALADNLGMVSGEVGDAIGSVRGLLDALSYMQSQFGGSAALGQFDDSAALVTAMQELGESIGVNLANTQQVFGWATPVLTALDQSPVCDADPSCRSSREQLRLVVAARGNGTFDKIADLARQLQQTQQAQTLSETVDNLRAGLDTAMKALGSMGLGEPGSIAGRLVTLQNGAESLADASRKLADGVALLVNQTKEMGAGLSEASAFLLAMRTDASTQSMAGFYIPPQVLTQDEFVRAADIFVSPDGHGVRYLISSDLNPFSTEAMDQVDAITDAARGALPNTTLADASVSMAGYSATLRDTRDYYNHDIRLIVAVTIVVVLLILVALLRAIVAPLYLIASVVISYLSALGLGVLFFQFLLGQELHWSVPGLAFVVLVAVGADYNLLLISRIRDESPHGVRSGVIRTVGSTGGVITSAGLIFAASMFGLVFASISTMVQSGFVIGIGLLLDTFVVRTVTVPAAAALVGDANWWPSRRESGRAKVTRPQPSPEPDDITSGCVDDDEIFAELDTPAPVASAP